MSGSNVEITYCEIVNSGDKGVSGGESSIVKIENTKINKAKIAIASKDLSVVNVSSVTVQNVDYGFVAFQKKPEFGPAKIIVTDLDVDLSRGNNLIDKGSLLILKGDTITGIKLVDVGSLYKGFN